MRKFARIKTKLISCILLLAMSALFLASANHVQADQEYLSFDQYKAEHYINYSSYEYFMSDDFKMPYRTTVEKDRSSATFNSLLAAWEVATFSGSNVVEMANKRKGYYEAFLFDIIYTGTDAVNVTDAMNAGIKATQASVLSKVTKLMDEGYYKDIDVRKLTEESYAKLVSGLESCGEFNDIFSAVNNVGKYVQYANDIETLVYRMAKIEAICGQSKEYAEVLRDMSKNTTDETLAAACDEMASICDGVMNAKLMDAIMTGEEVVTNVSKWVTDKIWDYVIDSLGACGIGVTAGQAVGKWASGLLFSTDKTIETYYEMSALYNFDNAIRKVVKKYERQYSRYSSDSVEYAKKFNASVELMLKTQELGCDISIKDAEYKYEKGIANVFVSRFNGKKEAMASYKKSLQGIKKNIAFIYTFANGDLYNCYKDEYCSNVSDDLGMTDVATTDDGSSASKADEKQVTQELIRTAEACCKKEIKEPMKLTGNVTYYGDVYVSSDLNLNGYKCTVYGNLIQSSGTLTLNGGTLDVSGDYRMENENVDSTGNVSYSGCYAYLNMTNDSDRVNVGGTFENYTWHDSSYVSYLHAGIMSVKGDFVCKYANDRFSTGGTHKVILNGTGVQKVQIAGGEGFNELDIQNDNVVFVADTNMKGFKVNHDITLNVSQGKELRISGTLDLNGHTLYAPGNLVLTGDGVNVKGGSIVVDGNLNLSCDVNLGGGKLQVKGNLIQSDDTLTVAGGTVDVSGDYRMENENVDSTGNVSYSGCYAYLNMTNDSDRVNVGGTFENYTWHDSSYVSYLHAGIMSVKGDFVCKYANDRFSTGGTHKVILNGTGVQKVQIAGGEGFNELDIQNDNVVFVADTNMKGFKVNHDITLNVSQGKELRISGTLDLNGHTLYAPGNLVLTGDGVNVKGGNIVVDGNLNLSCDVNLGGGNLQVKGNLIQSSYTLTVAGGTVDVSGDYRMENENVDSTGNVSYSYGYAILNMTNTDDRVNVRGTFENFSEYNSDLQAGVMSVKGDFICRDDYNGFYTGGTHKVILNGTGVQKVQIAEAKGFNELDIQNDKVVFVADTNMKGFKANHDITLNVSQGKTLQISGTLDLNGHTLYAPGNLTLTGKGVNVKGGSIVVDGNLNLSCDVNLGGGKLQVKGNLIQSDDTLTVAGGTVDVSGDYRMENENVDSTGNVSYSSGSAKLIMTNSADRVNVGGTFENYIWSSSSNISNLQAGVMSVKGDFICRDDCNGFYTGGTHKVILNGTGVQKVQIADSMGFNELDIQNDNVVFVADTDMKGFKANHDITLNVSQGKKLYISGTLDLNGHTLYAPGNLTLTGKGVNVKGGSIVVDGNLNLSCDVNLGGGKLQVKGNLIQSDDTLTVAGGTVDVSGDYRMENENVDSTGNVSYSGCSAKLNMTNTNDCVNVGGTFEFDASDGNLTDGIICIKKDFIIKSEYWRFNPTGNHTIKLDGDKVQKIQIDNSSNNKINNLYLTKDKSTGYNFVTDNCWNKLYLKTKVDKVTVSPELKDVCQGEQLQYSAQVSGVNSPSQDVTWSVTGAKSADTHIDENGLLSVAKDEAASNIVIKAVSAEDSSKTASQTVNITKRVPRVDAVRLSANTASMCPGDTHKFSAVVLGENDISQEVVWAVTGQQSADTKVAKDGTLTVGKDESADNISVVATSAVNNKVSASVKIQIVHIIIDSGVDQVAIVVKCGGSLSFEAHIVGINLSSDAVTWSVSNNTSKATSISHEGVLTVGEDEKAATLIVTATSVADPVKSASVNVKVEGSDNTKVVGYSVGLSDMISLNMYTYVPEKFLSDAGANAVFTLADGTVTQQPLSEFKKASYNGVNTVVINTKMVPAYITRSVTMKIVGSDGKESEGFTYSIYEYAKDYIKYATTETEYQKALPLVKAMLDYGAYSQLFFGVDASNLANYDRVSNLKLTEGNVEQTSCDSVFNAITNEETGTLGKEELIYQNISLICESETSMKLYFQNKNNLTLDQIKEKYAIKVYDSEGNVIPDDGCEMQVEGEKFWIKIKNLGPVKLSSDYTVEFTSDAGTQRGTVSPICYIKKAMKQDDMNLQNLCKAMYLYNKATLEYIGQ